MVASSQSTLSLGLMGLLPLLNRTALLQARPRLLLPVQSLVCLAAFGLALPLAISLFPQMSEVSGGLRAGREGLFINKDLLNADSLALR